MSSQKPHTPFDYNKYRQLEPMERGGAICKLKLRPAIEYAIKIGICLLIKPNFTSHGL